VIGLAKRFAADSLHGSFMNTANLLLLAQAAAPSGAQQQPNVFMSMMPLVFIFIIFYFLLIRPQQRKAKEHAKLVSALKTGDSVVTNAGIHGVISNVKEKTVIVKIADNVKVEFDRAAIVTVESSSSSESAA
jgi:preprotein translocase subunit YajC